MPFTVFGLLTITVVAALLLFAASASIGLLIGRSRVVESAEPKAMRERQAIRGTRRLPEVRSMPETEPAPARGANRARGEVRIS